MARKNREVKEIDWNIIEVGTPILVKDLRAGIWFKRRFAKYENGVVYTFIQEDADSLNNLSYWRYAKLPESEE